MYSKIKVPSAILLLVLLTWKCTSSLYKPTVYDSQRSGISVDTLISGRKLYVEKCASCHSLYLPSKYTRKDWGAIMESMESRSGLTADEKNRILLYLETGSKE